MVIVALMTPDMQSSGVFIHVVSSYDHEYAQRAPTPVGFLAGKKARFADPEFASLGCKFILACIT